MAQIHNITNGADVVSAPNVNTPACTPVERNYPVPM